MILKLFTKSYKNDYPWLDLALRSVIKLSKDPVDWTIAGDLGSMVEIENLVHNAVVATSGAIRYNIVEVPEHWPEVNKIQSGYLAQQWVKMNAHKVMGNDLFWNWDSDVIAIKPFSSSDFLGKTGKPVYWISQFNAIMSGADRPAHEGRIGLIKEIFGMNVLPSNYMRAAVPFEYMRCMPVPLHGNLLKICSETPEWQRCLQILQSGDHRFSEFNVIGNAFHMLFPEAFEWKNAEAEGPTWSGGYAEGGAGSGAFQEHAIICQNWSYGGIPQHVKDFVEKL